MKKIAPIICPSHKKQQKNTYIVFRNFVHFSKPYLKKCHHNFKILIHQARLYKSSEKNSQPYQPLWIFQIFGMKFYINFGYEVKRKFFLQELYPKNIPEHFSSFQTKIFEKKIQILPPPPIPWEKMMIFFFLMQGNLHDMSIWTLFKEK